MDSNIALQILVPATIAFLIGIAITPFVTHVLYTYKLWKPKGGKKALDGTPAEEFNRLHTAKEVGTPRFGGVIVWGSVLATACVMQALTHFAPDATSTLSFVSRSQTWLPLAAFLVGSIVGMLDDTFEVRGRQGVPVWGRLAIVSAIALTSAWWFYTKLDVSSISLPWGGVVELGVWFIAVFVVATLFMYAGGVIDGIDGLSGGVFSISFSAYAVIAFFQNQYDVAALCATITGGLLAFLWFNIPPARYYLSETGTMGLTIALAIIAFLTDTIAEGRGVAVLPLVALPLFATVASNVIQVLGKKFLKRKIFRIAPLHHHFEAIGWPAPKVVMRYWIVGIMSAVLGLVVAFW